jgi:hypothetical protein
MEKATRVRIAQVAEIHERSGSNAGANRSATCAGAVIHIHRMSQQEWSPRSLAQSTGLSRATAARILDLFCV